MKFVPNVTGITTAFVTHVLRRERISSISVASGAISLGSGLATSLAFAAHVVGVVLSGLAAHEPVVYETEQLGSLALGIATLIPGLLCLTDSGAVMRGELHAQKRTLAASVVVTGFTFPIATMNPLAALVTTLAVANIGVLLASPTNRKLSAPVASLRY